MSFRPKQKPFFGSYALLLGAALSLVACVHPKNTKPSSQTAVEHNLLPAVMIAGRSAPLWSVEDRLQRYNVPGVSIAVINDGQIDWAKGYGVLGVHGSEKVSTSTLFQAASIVKIVTAIGALRLVEDGVLALDTDINQQLRSWKVPLNRYTTDKQVTLRGLLSHSAGISVRGFSGYTHGEFLPNLLQVLNGEPPANSPPIVVNTFPGSIYRYSGGGYQIVQQLIEDATEQAFGQVMQEKVLDPVGMTDSTVMLPLSTEREDMTACGHEFDGSSVEGCWNMYPEIAAAWLWSTPTDLARLGITVSEAARGRSNKLLKQETAELMLTKVIGDTGLGPGVHGDGRELHFDHAGWTRGFRTYIVIYPYLGKGVVVMANGNGGHDLINEIVRSTAYVYDWPNFAPQQRMAASIEAALLQEHVGDYAVHKYGFNIAVRQEDDHLLVSTPRGSSYKFYPTSSNEYFGIEDGSELTFTRTPDGDRSMLHVWGMSATRD